MSRHPVREIKKYPHIAVANALGKLGWFWKKGRRPTNIDSMFVGMATIHIGQVLNELRKEQVK
jgi:hypothetical protein